MWRSRDGCVKPIYPPTLRKLQVEFMKRFRGFGGPQGMMIAEGYITHVAHYLGKPVEEIRVSKTHILTAIGIEPVPSLSGDPF
jgi:CO/xanthine dehydrogenase Mo-binding subunit